jgi:RNA polymerase sigma factor (sigma-70 family)
MPTATIGSVDAPGRTHASELVTRVRTGDRTAWTELTRRYTGLLWSIGRGMGLGHEDAADAVQLTWLRLVEGLDGIRQPEYLGSWLATTMRRECLAVLRRSTRERVGAVTDWLSIADPSGELDEALLRDERDAALWRAFRELKGVCQALLRVLMADPPPSYAEVSAALDMPVGSIGPTRQRCLRQLREIMQEGG